MARAAKDSILGHISRVESQLFCGLSFRQMTSPFLLLNQAIVQLEGTGVK